MKTTFPTISGFQKNANRINLSGHDQLTLYLALPESTRRRMELRQLEQTADRHYASGHVEFRSRKPKRPRRPAPKVTTSRDWYRPTEILASIPAETYLQILSPDSEPNRGKSRCPLPGHEDSNPSATYKDSVWFCHVCGTGGGIFQLGAALTGLGDHGDEFFDLRKWLAERMLGAAA